MSFPTNAEFAAAAQAVGLTDSAQWTPRVGGVPSGPPSTVIGKFVAPYAIVLGAQSESPSFYAASSSLAGVKAGDLIVCAAVNYEVRVVQPNTPVNGDTTLQLAED